MADIRFNDLTEKTTPVSINDETLIIDSEDLSKVKRIKATQYKWPKWDTGPAGPTGPQWPQGPTWATGPQWPAWADWLGVNWKWAYSWTTAYVINDAVSYNGNSYIAIQATTGNVPTNTTYWNLMAQKWLNWTGSWDMSKSTYDTNNNWVVDDSEKLGWQLPSYYEPAFTKNTWFNLNLWTTAWTVSEWNHTHTTTDITNLSTDTVTEWTTNLYYTDTRVSANVDVSANTTARHTHSNKTILDQIAANPVETITAWTNITVTRTWNDVTIDSTASGLAGWIDSIKIAWQQIVWTEFYEYDADSAKTIWNVSVSLQVAPAWTDFIVTWYKNWTSVWTTTILTTATATNWRYKTVTALNTTLIAWDVFTGKITQVGSTVSWAEFSALINIS